jgi:hypothetical protein
MQDVPAKSMLTYAIGYKMLPCLNGYGSMSGSKSDGRQQLCNIKQ